MSLVGYKLCYCGLCPTHDWIRFESWSRIGGIAIAGMGGWVLKKGAYRRAEPLSGGGWGNRSGELLLQQFEKSEAMCCGLRVREAMCCGLRVRASAM